MWQKLKTEMRVLVIIAIAVACVLASGIITLVSYVSYQNYYKDMLEIKAELEEQKRLEEEMKKLRFNGLGIRLAEGVEYFDNGKARPVKTDFVVEGNYSIGGRDYSEEILANDYTLEVPSDFVVNGGTVTAKYIYVTQDKDENGDPVTNETEYTAQLELSLTEVKFAKIEVTKEPYIVYYKAGETFKKDGMQISALNNDGSVARDLTEADIKTDNVPLAAGAEKARFWCEDTGGEKVYGEVSVTVVEEADYDNGGIVEMSVIGDLQLDEGQPLSAVKMRVMGRYSSGNLMEMKESEYKMSDVAAGVDAVKFGGKYTFKVEKADNPDMFAYARVRVNRRSEAESATLSGGATAVGNSVGSLVSGSKIEFNINSDADTYADVYVTVSNGRLVFNGMTYLGEESELFDVMNVRVNSKLSLIGESALPAGGPYATLDEAYSDYTRIYLGKHWLTKGDNKIALEFRDSKKGIKDYEDKAPIGRVDCIEVLSFDDSRIIDSIGEYVQACNETNVVQKYTTVQTLDWTDFGFGNCYVYSACTDNTYIYMYGRLGNNSTVRLIKYDPRNDTTVGWSNTFALSSEANAVLYYNDGFVYTTDASGNFLRMSVNDLDTGGSVAPEATDTVPLEPRKVNGMYYNPIKRLYAVLNGNRVEIFDRNGQKLRSIDIPLSTTGTNINGTVGTIVTAARITGNGRFIYVMYKANVVMAPVTRIYTFDGEFVDQVQFPNTREIMNVADGYVNANAQSIVDMNGDVYFTLLQWNPNRSSVYKVEFNYEFTGTAHKDLGSYYEACTEKGAELKYSVEVISGTTLKPMEKYVKGMCTDGEYIYVSASDPCGEYGDGRVVVHKIDMTTGDILGASSIAYNRESSEQFANAGYLYYEDGKIYLACTDGKIRYVYAAEIEPSGGALWHEAELDFDIGTVVRSFTYNPALHEYAVVGKDAQMRIVDANTFEIKNTVSLSGNLTGLYSDVNYIYSLYEGGAGNVTVNVYDWEGNKIGNVSMPGVISASSSNNVHSMFVKDDNIYFLFCAWESSGSWREGGIVVKMTLDYSVLDA